jgi:hypothetical protein
MQTKTNNTYMTARCRIKVSHEDTRLLQAPDIRKNHDTDLLRTVWPDRKEINQQWRDMMNRKHCVRILDANKAPKHMSFANSLGCQEIFIDNTQHISLD